MSVAGQIATIFELGVGIFIEIIAIQLFLRYRNKKNRSIILLAIATAIFGVSAFCSFTARFLVHYLDFVGTADPTMNYITALFLNDRLALICDSLGFLAFYLFANEVFGVGKSKVLVILMAFFSSTLVVFMFWDPANINLNAICFVCILVYGLLVTIPIIVRSKRAQTHIEDPIFRIAYSIVRYMTYCFILTFLMFILDQVLMGFNLEFNIFYYMGWIFTILVGLFGYLGYLLPNWFRNIISKK
ncbi:MAG: hypothetical protein RBG13Loki_1255 [Promethearchaeota archaeon CR_4]|nr:MAG: hypothetical protein RBG13Loki_1255 [Candidatus Lokiarchaeota archaeon CR_4]